MAPRFSYCDPVTSRLRGCATASIICSCRSLHFPPSGQPSTRQPRPAGRNTLPAGHQEFIAGRLLATGHWPPFPGRSELALGRAPATRTRAALTCGTAPPVHNRNLKQCGRGQHVARVHGCEQIFRHQVKT